jgi:transposase InsO family protein
MKHHAKRFSVEMMSRVLGVSRSGYYKWLKISCSKERALSLDEQIKVVFEQSKCRYGSPRVCKEINKKRLENKLSSATVARRMQALRLVARPKRKYVHTTDSDHELKVSPNLLNRNFAVEKVNTVWVSDITYINTDDGWRYLTIVLDLADRAVIGWTLSQTMHAQCTVIEALKQAIHRRGIQPHGKLMFHSDRGVQYACDDFRALLAHYRITQSMSRKGNCWDNAVAESFFKTIKTEELNRLKTIKAQTLNSLVFKYIEGWYNTQRIHSALNGLTPWEAFYEKSLKLAA